MPAAYDAVSRGLHWTTAVMVLLMWLLGRALTLLPHNWAHTDRQIHVYLGVALTAALLFRVIWRFTKAQRPEAVPDLAGKAAGLMQATLYGLMFAIVGLGLFAVWNKGGPYLNGLLYVTPYGDADKAARKALSIRVLDLHDLLANILLALAFLHAAAALFHHYALKDGVFRRM
jgi:cytochrome b561